MLILETVPSEIVTKRIQNIKKSKFFLKYIFTYCLNIVTDHFNLKEFK